MSRKLLSGPKNDLTGQVFGRLAVIRIDGKDSGSKWRWLCQCECGNIVSVLGYNLKSGNSRSCGCLCADNISARSTIHGLAKTTEHIAWSTMKQRCCNQKKEHFDHYGGRGIKVCERWVNSFTNFLADMGPRPSSRHSIERNDVNGDYSPENCRWATKKEQMRNMRRNRLIVAFGVSHCINEWAELTGIHRATIAYRIDRGWGAEKALAIKPTPGGNSSRGQGKST